MTDENPADEKLLKSPLDTPELTSAETAEPTLTVKDFVKTTPDHELKNLFGLSPKETLKPLKVGEEKNTFTPLSYYLPKKESQVKTNPWSEPTTEPKTGKKTLRFPAWLSLVFIIIFIGLYIWGGILKGRGYSVPASNTVFGF